MLIRQVIRSGTSIGANYRDANGAESRKGFAHKIRISLKEARETKYWLSLLVDLEVGMANELESLFDEVHEFSLIFGKISSGCEAQIKI